MCGKNGFDITDNEFIAGCNRFGLDNPTPIITRRLATYGNEEAVEKLVERMARQYNDERFLDPERFGSTLPDKTPPKVAEMSGIKSPKDSMQVRDMAETAMMKRNGKKVSGVHDIKMLERLDGAKKFESPANVVLARGIALKIKDIPKNTTLKGKVVGSDKQTNIEQSVSKTQGE